MSEPIKEKFGMFKELVGLIDKNFRATMTTIVVLGLAYFIWKNDRDKERLYGEIINEVRKQLPAEVNKQVAPIKSAADSTNAKVDTTLSKLDTTLKNVKQFIKSKT